MQPVYAESSPKMEARSQNVALYRRLTGNHRIPANREYWTLANVQPLHEGSEISQMVDEGLITKSQFHGVDRDTAIIAVNKRWHPEAHWYAGEWEDVIAVEDFNPALVYLDTTSFADQHTAIALVTETMMLCPAQTVLFANLMLNSPYSGRKFNPNTILAAIGKSVPARELEQWNLSVENFEYTTTGKTHMLTYVIHKIGRNL